MERELITVCKERNNRDREGTEYDDERLGTGQVFWEGTLSIQFAV